MTRRALLAEALSSLMLFATVIGSGIMAEQLADGNVALALLGNSLATGAIPFVLITMFGLSRVLTSTLLSRSSCGCAATSPAG
jgi:glycerol uptake facilitator-like aquaporin